MLNISFGIAMLILQGIAYIGSIYAGNLNFFGTFSLYEIFYFIGYNLVGIIGLIVLICGIYKTKKEKPSMIHEPTTMTEEEIKDEIMEELQYTSENEERKMIMFCQYCGKQIMENADVCIGCGKLLHAETRNAKKLNLNSKNLFDILSICNLVFCSVFLIIGIASLIMSEMVFFAGRLSTSTYLRINTYSFVSLLVSVLSSSTSAIISMILLTVSNRKLINIISLGIAVGLLAITGILTFFAGV